MLASIFDPHVRELEAAQREAVAALAAAAAESQPDTESSEDSEQSESEEQPPGIFVQAYLRGSAASKSGLKPEVVPADEPLSDRVVVPPEGSALPEAGVYIASGKRVSFSFERVILFVKSVAQMRKLFCVVSLHSPCRCATCCSGRTE
jgi:hypothetical protein